MIQMLIEGEPVWREVDLVRSFGTEAEAIAYAEAHSITDIVLQVEPGD